MNGMNLIMGMTTTVASNPGLVGSASAVLDALDTPQRRAREEELQRSSLRRISESVPEVLSAVREGARITCARGAA